MIILFIFYKLMKKNVKQIVLQKILSAMSLCVFAWMWEEGGGMGEVGGRHCE